MGRSVEKQVSPSGRLEQQIRRLIGWVSRKVGSSVGGRWVGVGMKKWQ